MSRAWLVVALAACGSSKQAPPASGSGSGSGSGSAVVALDAAPPDAGAPPFELPAPSDPIVDLSGAPSYACASHESGAISCWGKTGFDAPLDRGSRLVRSDDAYRCVLQGTEVACGAAGSPLAAIATTEKTGMLDIVDLAIGNPSLLLTRDGSVFYWNQNAKAPAKPVPGIADATAIATSGYLSCLVRKTGQVVCADGVKPAFIHWQPAPLKNVRLLAFASDASVTDNYGANGCAILASGEPSCFAISGRTGHAPTVTPSDDGVPRGYQEAWRNASQLVGIGGAYTALVAGKVIISVSDQATPLPLLADAVSITDHCALRKQGSIVCWGPNADGAAGQPPSTGPFSSPVAVPNL